MTLLINAEIVQTSNRIGSSFALGNPPKERKLEINSSSVNSGYYMNKLLQTHNVSDMSLLQQQRQGELDLFDRSFKNIDSKVDEFRDNVAKKLFELKTSLERPKAPILSVNKLMKFPESNSLNNSDLTEIATSRKSRKAIDSLQNDFQTTLNKIQSAKDSLMSMAEPASVIRQSPESTQPSTNNYSQTGKNPPPSANAQSGQTVFKDRKLIKSNSSRKERK